jgi:hypothetical protein
MTTSILTLAHVPDDLQHEWLQHLRDFDAAHPGCHFSVIADGGTKTVAEMVKVLNVNPPFDFMTVMPTPKNDAS